MLAVVAVLALGGAALALRLEPSAATSTLVDRSSDSFKATERFKQDFGDDAVLVLVQGDLSKTVLSEDLGRLLSLEGCLGGNGSPKALRRLLRANRKDPATGFPPVCEEIAKLKPAKAVYGPGTFVNTAVDQIQDELRGRLTATPAAAEARGRGRAQGLGASAAIRRRSRSGWPRPPATRSRRSSPQQLAHACAALRAHRAPHASTTRASSRRSCSPRSRGCRSRASRTCSRRRTRR